MKTPLIGTTFNINLKRKKRLGVIMTYYNRQEQLDKTLKSISEQNYNDVFIVIVDDCSIDKIILPNLNLNIDVIRISKEEKMWRNPEPAYNRGILHLIKNYNPEIIIIQNAECYHVGNIIEYAINNTTINNYITFGCYGIDKKNTFDSNFDIHSFIKIPENNTKSFVNASNCWYNHPQYRPVAYEFCSSIHKNNLISLNGYDERLSFGSGYGDDFLLHRIKLLNLQIQITSTPFVVHQWHDDSVGLDKYTLAHKNRLLFNELKGEKKIKAVHLFNDDLC